MSQNYNKQLQRNYSNQPYSAAQSRIVQQPNIQNTNNQNFVPQNQTNSIKYLNQVYQQPYNTYQQPNNMPYNSNHIQSQNFQQKLPTTKYDFNKSINSNNSSRISQLNENQNANNQDNFTEKYNYETQNQSQEVQYLKKLLEQQQKFTNSQKNIVLQLKKDLENEKNQNQILQQEFENSKSNLIQKNQLLQQELQTFQKKNQQLQEELEKNQSKYQYEISEIKDEKQDLKNENHSLKKINSQLNEEIQNLKNTLPQTQLDYSKNNFQKLQQIKGDQKINYQSPNISDISSPPNLKYIDSDIDNQKSINLIQKINSVNINSTNSKDFQELKKCKSQQQNYQDSTHNFLTKTNISQNIHNSNKKQKEPIFQKKIKPNQQNRISDMQNSDKTFFNLIYDNPDYKSKLQRVSEENLLKNSKILPKQQSQQIIHQQHKIFESDQQQFLNQNDYFKKNQKNPYKSPEQKKVSRDLQFQDHNREQDFSTSPIPQSNSNYKKIFDDSNQLHRKYSQNSQSQSSNASYHSFSLQKTNDAQFFNNNNNQNQIQPLNLNEQFKQQQQQQKIQNFDNIYQKQQPQQFNIHQKPQFNQLPPNDSTNNQLNLQDEHSSNSLINEKNLNELDSQNELLKNQIYNNKDNNSKQQLQQQQVQSFNIHEGNSQITDEQFQQELNNQYQKFNLFEEFFIITADKSQLKTIKNVGDIENLDPVVLYSYPGETEKKNCDKRNIVPEFAFPFGVEVQKCKKTDSLSDLNQIIFGGTQVERYNNCFVFAIKSEESYMKKKNLQHLPPLLTTVNPNALLYCIAVTTKDFLEEEKSTEKNYTLKKNYFTVNNTFLIMTYFPFINFWIDLIQDIISKIKISKLETFSQQYEQSDLSQIDVYFYKKIENDIKQNLVSVYETPLPNFSQKLQFTQTQDELSLTIPNQEDCVNIEAEWGMCLALNNMDCIQFAYILCSLMLEKSVVFVSDNRALLTATILLFHTALKPFKWPHPLIFTVSDNLLHIFDSPVPIICGLHKDYSYVKDNQLIQDYDSVSFINLDEFFIDNQHVEILNYDFYNNLTNHLQEYFMQYKKIQNMKNQQNNQVNLKFQETTIQEQNIVKQILLKTSEFVNQKILDDLPDVPILRNSILKQKDQKILDIAAIEKFVENSNENIDFIKKFFQTQVFTFYIEEYYEI